jgi:hypothetical protein
MILFRIFRTTISEDDVFLRASCFLQFPRGSNAGILQKVTKKTKSHSFYPGSSFPSLPSVKSEMGCMGLVAAAPR